MSRPRTPPASYPSSRQGGAWRRVLLLRESERRRLAAPTPAPDDVRERGSISRGRLLRPGGAGVRGGRSGALVALRSERLVCATPDARSLSVAGTGGRR